MRFMAILHCKITIKMLKSLSHSDLWPKYLVISYFFAIFTL